MVESTLMETSGRKLVLTTSGLDVVLRVVGFSCARRGTRARKMKSTHLVIKPLLNFQLQRSENALTVGAGDEDCRYGLGRQWRMWYMFLCCICPFLLFRIGALMGASILVLA